MAYNFSYNLYLFPTDQQFSVLLAPRGKDDDTELSKASDTKPPRPEDVDQLDQLEALEEDGSDDADVDDEAPGKERPKAHTRGTRRSVNGPQSSSRSFSYSTIAHAQVRLTHAATLCPHQYHP